MRWGSESVRVRTEKWGGTMSDIRKFGGALWKGRGFVVSEANNMHVRGATDTV